MWPVVQEHAHHPGTCGNLGVRDYFLILNSCVREGPGNPLQCSCLENSVGRGAWWAAVHGVVQSWTRLKQLSMHACIGEGTSNPLQCSCLENSVDRGAWQATVHGITKSQRQLTLFSCLENPRDGGAWWAAVYGVAQSRTRLKRLSSSSSSFLIRARTQAPAVRALNPTHWITGEFPPNY